MKFIELFAGIGGFRLGLNVSSKQFSTQGRKTKNKKTSFKQDMSFATSKGRTNTSEFCCVFANEWDKYACQIYRKNFGKGELYEGNIRGVSAKSIPNHDLLVAGFPCQSFSIAGKRKGFRDTRGTLFFEICRIVEEKKPNLLLLENVKGLLNHDGGNTFRIILNSLSELGYDCEWEVLNSKNFGVPQNRERIFIIGHLRGKGGQKVFPIGGSGKKTKDLVYVQKADREIARIYDPKGLAPTLHLKTGGWQEPKIQVALKYRNQKTVYNPKGISPTFREGHGDGVRITLKDIIERKQDKLGRMMPIQRLRHHIRRLTPTECERLQGFPDGWTEGISDTQRYKCLGNAVTTNVITEIGKKIFKVVY